MLSLLLLALPLSASAKAIFAFAPPAASQEINVTPNIEEAPALFPREWDTMPTEPYTLPMVPATTAIPTAWTAPPVSTSASSPHQTPTYTYAETHNDDKNTLTHEYIAVVIGAIFIGVPVLMTVIFCLCRRCRGSREDEEVEKKEEEHEAESEGRQSLMSIRYSVDRGDRERAGGRYPEIKYWV